MPYEKNIFALPGLQEVGVTGTNPIEFRVRMEGRPQCPHCGVDKLRNKGPLLRRIRHESIGNRASFLCVELTKYRCLGCRRYFVPRIPGLLPYQRATESFRREVALRHYNGICQSTLAKEYRMGAATVERWFHEYLLRKEAELRGAVCPRVLGIDEHFFTRSKGYSTTLCDLSKPKVYDVLLGRSEKSIGPLLDKIPGRERCRVVVMDLSETYRSIAKRYFPNALTVADRFHVIRLINHSFLKQWGLLDEVGRKNRGLLSLMRRHSKNLRPDQAQNLARYFHKNPAVGVLYQVKDQLCGLMNVKTATARNCRKIHIPAFLEKIRALKNSGFKILESLGQTLESWDEEIVRMWRFSKTNSITEGFHNKIEVIQRRAYGMRNFNNYRLRVRVMCS